MCHAHIAATWQKQLLSLNTRASKSVEKLFAAAAVATATPSSTFVLLVVGRLPYAMGQKYHESISLARKFCALVEVRALADRWRQRVAGMGTLCIVLLGVTSQIFACARQIR